MTESDQDTTREAITTYVPAYQKAEWRDHASELEMTQAEYVRTMVQAGRNVIDGTADSSQSSGSTPRGNVEETVLQALESAGPLSWTELVEAATDELESQLEDAVVSLQKRGRIEHRPRDGTYTLQDE
ncbi:MAG: DUF5805 domain-containing protein [Halodesulfurarchaeum sp.]